MKQGICSNCGEDLDDLDDYDRCPFCAMELEGENE